MVASSKRARVLVPANSSGSRTSLPSRLLAAGVILASLGVAIAMAPGAYNPFGPAKAFALLVGAASVVASLAVDRGLAADAWSRARRLPAVWLAGALLLLASLATITSMDPSQSLIGHHPEYGGLALLLLAAIIGVGAFVYARRPSAWRTFGRVAVVVLLVVCGYALLQYAGVDPVPSLLAFTVRRVRSTLGNASNLGVFLVLATPLAIARVREERAGWRWVSWVAVGSGAVVLALSLSRGAWAGAAAGAVCWLVSEARRWDQARRVKVGLASLLVGVAAVALVVGVVPNAGARVAELADPSAGTAGWRTVVWSQSLRMVADRPLLGFGPGSFRYAFPQYRTAATMTGEGGAQVLEDPHNILVSAAVATGVPGLLVLVALLATIFGAAWRIDEGADAEPGLAGPAIIAALAGGFAALQFHFFTLDTLPLFAALAGLALAHAESASAGREVPGLPGSIAAVRWIAALVAGVLTAASLAAGGLVLADYAVASGFGLVGTGAPWAAARAEFERARALAPWEPALQWALGRAATQRISSAHETAAFPDAEAAMLSAGRRLPADPLLVAQTSELYLVEGLATQDREAIQRSLVLAERAIALDPQNGYRWETKGTALAALGDSAGAVTALRTSVGYSPEDSGAWASLAAVYRRLGDTVSAAVAQARADALTNRP